MYFLFVYYYKVPLYDTINLCGIGIKGNLSTPNTKLSLSHTEVEVSHFY